MRQDSFNTAFAERFRALSESERRELVRRIEEESRRRGFLNYGKSGEPPAPHPLALTPLVIPCAALPKLHELARTVARFAAKLPRLWLYDVPEIRRIFPIDARTAEWMTKYHRERPEPDDLFVRLDVGFRRDSAATHRQRRGSANAGPWEGGAFRPVLFENNPLALAGLLNHTVGSEILEQIVWPAVFGGRMQDAPQAGSNLIEFGLRWVKRRFREIAPRGSAPYLFVLDDPRFLRAGSEFPHLQHEFTKRGIRTVHGHAGMLTALDVEPPDLIWRELAYRELALPAYPERERRFFRFLEAGRILHGFASEFAEKGLLECFTNERYRPFFTSAEWGMLRDAVPWTRVLWERTTEAPDGATVPLFEFVRVHKDALLIKPNREAGGVGITIGREATQAAWDEKLMAAAAVPSQWVVQEFVETLTAPAIFLKNGRIYDTSAYATIGLFYFHDELGLHGRIGVGRVVNVAQGGALAPVFIQRYDGKTF